MKDRNLPISSRGSRKLAGASIVLAFSLLTPSAFASAYTWSNVGTDFADGANWGGTAPADNLTADSAVFNAATTAIPTLAADRSILGVDFQAAGGAELTSAAGVILTLGATGIDATTQLAGTNAVSVTHLKLGATQEWKLFSNTASISTSCIFSVSSNIDLNGQNLTVYSNRSGTGSGNGKRSSSSGKGNGNNSSSNSATTNNI